MTTVEGTAANPDRSVRDQILDAAHECFVRYGIEGTKIDDVVRLAKVPRATLYRHAGGKDALLTAVALRQLDRFMRQLWTHLAGIDEIRELLVEGAAFTIEHYRRDELLALALDLGFDSARAQAAAELTIQVRDQLAQAFGPLARAAQAAGALRSGLSPEDVVEWTMRVIGTLVLAPGDRSPAQERAYLRRLFVPSLVPDDAPTNLPDLGSTR